MNLTSQRKSILVLGTSRSGSKRFVTVSSPEEAAVKRALFCQNGQFFRWAFLGASVLKAVSIRDWMGSRGEEICIGEMLQVTAASLRQPYIDYIGKLSCKENSLEWWVGPVSEKNPFRSKVFANLTYLGIYKNIIKSDEYKNDNIVLFVESEALRECIAKNFSNYNNTEFELVESFRDNITIKFKELASLVLRRIGFIIINVYRILVAGYLCRLSNVGKYGERDNLVLIHTWVDRGSFYGPQRGYRENYFGGLISHIEDSGKNAVLVPYILKGAPSYKRTLGKLITSGKPFLVPHFFLEVTDILKVFIKTIKPPKKRDYPHFGGMDISTIIYDDYVQSYIRNDIAPDLLFYELIRHLKENDVNIERLIYPYENHSWEKIVCLAVREFYPQVRLVAHQHANISSMLLNYFFSKEESRVLPFPDIVITNGKYSDRLFRNSGYDPDKVILGGSVRYTGVLSALDEGDKVTSPKENNSRCPTILVTPSLEWAEAAEFIWKVIGAFGTLDQYRVILKCHPDLPYNRIARELKISTLPGHFTVVDRPVGELLLESDVLLYTSSTTCIEALARGVPVVQVNSSLTIDMDPLRGYPGVRRSVSTQEEIVEAVKEILTTNRAEQIKGKTVWKDTVKDLFVPVDENIFHLFLN